VDPRAPLSWSGLGYSLLWQEHYGDAIAAFERANELAPHAYAWAGIGQASLMSATRFYVSVDRRKDLLERARASFTEALALQPGMPRALFGMTLLSLVSALPGAPPLSLGVLAALALLWLFVSAVLRLARKPRETLRADARALFSGVLVPFVFTRALVLCAFWFSPLWLEPKVTFSVTPLVGSDNPIFQAAAERWDSNLYVLIALAGYKAGPLGEGGWGLLGQLPLLPVLYRFTMQLLGDEYWSALILPHVALLIATSSMFFLVRQTDGESIARRASWLLLLVPGAVFGSALYAEPIALAGLVAAQAHARQGWVATSLVSGMLAGMARVNALAAVPMLALGALSRALKGSRWALLAPLGPPLGLIVFMLYTHFEFGDAFAYFNELRENRFTNQGPAPALNDIGLMFVAMQEGKHSVNLGHNSIGVLAIGCLLAYAWAGIDLWRRGRYAEASFVFTGVLLAIGSNLASQARYLWMLFPAYVSFAQLGDKPLVRWIAFGSLSILLFVLASAFAQFYGVV
jgi:tetratricopeptide (TPR) repeat protein